MARTDTLGNFLTDISNAIKEKKGTEEKIKASDFDEEIRNISTFKKTNPGSFDIKEDNTITEFDSELLDLSNISGFNYTFYYCKKLQKVTIRGPLPKIYLTFEQTFGECNSLTELKFIDCDYIYYNSLQATFWGCKKIKEFDLSNWIPDEKVSFSSVFVNCTEMTKLTFNEKKFWAYSLYQMFHSCSLIEEINIPLIGADNLYAAFCACRALKRIPNINSWDVSNCGSFMNMFASCTSLEELDLSNWELKEKTTTSAMFQSCTSLKKLDIRKMEFSKISTYDGMFSGVQPECLIIVKDEDNKQWLLDNFDFLENVKTVEEVSENG